MTERGIIFGADDVRAIEAGTKTMFRRAMRPQPEIRDIGGRFVYGMLSSGSEEFMCKQPWNFCYRCPRPGDRIYVRETWAGRMDIDGNAEPERARHYVRHRAGSQFDPADEMNWHEWGRGWRSPATMPRWAARIWLVVTAVRAEPLQNISIDDLIAEGWPATHSVDEDASQAYEWFADKWDATAKPGQKWDDNPWVWVTTFGKVLA
jgi:hypothetical protein